MGLPANSTNYLKRSNLSIDSNVFTLYGSGGKVSKKNPIIFPVLLLLVFVVVLFYGFSYALTMFSPDDDDDENVFVSSVPVHKVHKISSTSSNSLIRDNDVMISSSIYSYFVDEEKLTLTCENNLIVPLHFAPKPRFKTTAYNSMKYYYYLSPLKYCMIVDNNIKDDSLGVSF